MEYLESYLKGCFVLNPKLYFDERGFFYESFNKKDFLEKTSLEVNFVQDNQSFSKKNVLRGLHYQKNEFAQAKLVRVLQGKVLDVAVDLRKNSKTFGKYFSILLSGENKRELFIPRDFAHGFVTLSDSAIFNYKCDNYYNKESEAGIIYNDETLNIDWGSSGPFELSEKDLELPFFQEIFKKI